MNVINLERKHEKREQFKRKQRYFYIYHSINVSIVLLFRKEKRDKVEMIRWDTNTDTFIAGQWLMKKAIDFKNSFLSADGLSFHYVYYTYLPTDEFREKSYIVESRVPNFTAEKICYNGRGHWNDAKVNEDDIPELEPPFLFVDSIGRTITTNEYIIYADGVQLYDATDHVFIARKPMDIHGNELFVSG
jgi:hypothetical protein